MPTTRILTEAATMVTGAAGGIDAGLASPVPRHGVAVGPTGTARPGRAARR